MLGPGAPSVRLSFGGGVKKHRGGVGDVHVRREATGSLRSRRRLSKYSTCMQHTHEQAGVVCVAAIRVSRHATQSKRNGRRPMTSQEGSKEEAAVLNSSRHVTLATCMCAGIARVRLCADRMNLVGPGTPADTCSLPKSPLTGLSSVS